jgi:hypothetical protein
MADRNSTEISYRWLFTAPYHRLLNERLNRASYAGKKVIRAGEVVQGVHDGDQKVQSLDWVLIDIVSPFYAEYYDCLPFGSLWREWLGKLAAAGRFRRSGRPSLPRESPATFTYDPAT